MKDWPRWASFLVHLVAAAVAFLVLLEQALIEAKVGRAGHDWWAQPRLQLAGIVLVGWWHSLTAWQVPTVEWFL
jgi:hypothetical protein